MGILEINFFNVFFTEIKIHVFEKVGNTAQKRIWEYMYEHVRTIPAVQNILQNTILPWTLWHIRDPFFKKGPDSSAF